MTKCVLFIPDVLCDHNMVVSGCFDPFGTSSDGFLLISTTPLDHVHVRCVVTWIVLIRQSWLWEYPRSWFTLEPVHECTLDIYHLHGLWVTYPEHVFFWFVCWSPGASYSQMIWTSAWHSNVTHVKHLPLKFSIGHVLGGVNPRGRCGVWHRRLRLQGFPKIQKIRVSRFVSQFEYDAPLLDEGIIVSVGDDLSGGLIKQPTPI